MGGYPSVLAGLVSGCHFKSNNRRIHVPGCERAPAIWDKFITRTLLPLLLTVLIIHLLPHNFSNYFFRLKKFVNWKFPSPDINYIIIKLNMAIFQSKLQRYIYLFYFIYFISIFILLTRRKATEALIHSVGNYLDLLPEIPRYCCLVI